MLRKFVFTPPALLAVLYALGPLSMSFLNSGGTAVSWYPVFVTAISIVFSALSIGWPAAALHLLKREKSDVEAVRSNNGFIFLAIFGMGLLLGLGSLLLTETGVASPFQNVGDGFKEALSLAAIFLLFAFFWSVSSAFVDAEDEKSAGFVRRVGGFFGIFYFFVGIFFLSPRLKKILSQN